MAWRCMRTIDITYQTDLKDGKMELFNHFITMFDRDKAFSKASVNEMVAISKRTILNIVNT